MNGERDAEWSDLCVIRMFAFVHVCVSITLSHYSRVVARFSWTLCICSPWPPFCYRQDSCLFCDSGFYSRLLCVFRCVRRDPPTRSVSLRRSADALLLPSSSETPSSKISEETSPLGTVCTDGWCRAALRPDMFFLMYLQHPCCHTHPATSNTTKR